MKLTKIFALSVFLLVLMSSFASATGIPTLGKVREIPLNTCAGQGELYLYEGEQSQEASVLFTVQRDELLVFARSNRVSEIEINLEVPDLVFSASDPFAIDIYATEIDTPGGVVYADITSSKGARGVQGFLAQDSANPIYDPTEFEIIYDGEEENTIFLHPGVYQYVFFDKYDKYSDAVTDDSRELTVTVEGASGVISQETYTKPTPDGTTGAVVHEFEVFETGYYTVSLSTEDSIYWGMFTCHAQREDHCEGADFVVETDMWVVGDGCHHSGKIQDVAQFDVPESKTYYVTGSVYRGKTPDGNCQGAEEFTTTMNGQTGPVVEDELDPCSPAMSTEEYLGTFDLVEGTETVTMDTAAFCPPETTANSVDLTQLCFYDDEEVPEFGAIAAGVALVGAIAGFFIFRRKH